VLGFSGFTPAAHAEQLVCAWADSVRPDAQLAPHNPARRVYAVTAYQPRPARYQKRRARAKTRAFTGLERAFVRRYLSAGLLIVAPWECLPAPTPIVIKPPIGPGETTPPGGGVEQPPGGTPSGAPEPASLLTALLGSGLAGGMALRWRRKMQRPH
jgi:hypothetical protein